MYAPDPAQGSTGFCPALGLPEEALGGPLDELAHRFGSAPIDWRLLAAALRFDRERYHRELLLRTDAYELLLVGWLPGQGSRIHDHGGAEGIVRVLSGQLEETVYALRRGRAVARHTRSHLVNAVLVERHETLHSVINPGPRPAVSLHLYRPPQRAMREYARAPR